MSIMVMSNVPVLLMGLLLIFCWIHWQQSRRMRWALAMGIFAGWCAVSRPLEATCFAVPVGVAILIRLRDWNWRERLATITLIVVGAAPFLTLQIAMNRNITGDWRTPPWQYYSNRDFPQTTMGFRQFDPTLRPVSKLPQKQAIFDMFVPDVVQDHQPKRILQQWLTWRGPILVAGTMPYSILLIFIPVGIVLCKNRERLVLLAVLPMFIVLYTISVVFQIYYPIVVIPSVLLLILLGVNVFRDPLRAALLLWLAFMAITALPEANAKIKDRLFEPRLMRQVDQWEQNYSGGRALVLFRYSPQRNIHEEPVYNTATAWPDDARIIRANDFGSENHRIFDYYAKSQPDREVFLFEEETNSYTRLGTVAELAKSLTNLPRK
jgi:4-amino-4-deoxy-L-arabinose transferase-like glycosyltransferase